jgi:hypothetical protein
MLGRAMQMARLPSLKGFLAIKQHGTHAMARQCQRRRHADRAGADDNDGMTRALALALGRMPDREDRVVEVE